MIRLAALGAGLLLLTYVALWLHVPGALTVGSPQAKTAFVALLAVAAGVYLIAVAWVLRRGALRGAVWLVLAVAVLLRVGPLLAPPFLSTDIYRYVWDGRVQAAGINPYRYVPADPALTELRDDAVYPHINRADYAPTIYPPTAQGIYAAVGLLWPSVTGMKLAMVGFEAVAAFCMLRMLSLGSLPLSRVLIYAWNPLPVWAFAGNGHVDAVAIGLLALALLLRIRLRDRWTGVALGAAVLVKFLPIVVAPALWRRAAGWRMAVACGTTIVLLYLPYLSVGTKVFGFLGGYGAEEGLDAGTGFWLLAGVARFLSVPPIAAVVYIAVCMALLAGLALWIAFVRRPDDPASLCAAGGILMAVLTVAISPHYPWYFAWLALPAVLAPYRSLIWLSTSPVLLYLDTNGDRFILPSVVYVPALALVLVDCWQRPRILQPVEGRI